MASFTNVTNVYNNRSPKMSAQGVVKSHTLKTGKPQLIITVEIGDGRVGEIHYYNGDEYKDLAARFCNRYDLPPAVIDALTQHIYKNVKALKEKKEAQEKLQDSEEEEVKRIDSNDNNNVGIRRVERKKKNKKRQNKSTKDDGVCSDGDLDVEFGQRKKTRRKLKKKKVLKKRNTKRKKSGKGKASAKDVYMRLYLSGKETQNRLDRSAEDAKLRRQTLDSNYTFKPNINPNPTGWENGESEMKDYFNRMGLTDQGRRARGGKSKRMDVHNRLYIEGMHETKAKLQQAKDDKRKFDESDQTNWSCPRCCYVNDASDEFCLNLVKNGRKQIEVSKRGTEVWQDNGAYLDREDFSKFGGRSGGPVDSSRKVVQKVTWQCCGYDRPIQMFRPKIGKMSKNMIRTEAGFDYAPAANRPVRRNGGGSSSSVFDALYNPKALSRRVIDLAELQAQKEMEECTFQPSINKKSVEIAHNRRNNSTNSKHDELFRDASRRRIKRDHDIQEQMSKYTFKPNIGVNRKTYMATNEKTCAPNSSAKDASDFYQRLEKADKAREEHLRQLQEDISKYDEHTGQKLFKPKVGRAPHYDRNMQGLSIHDFLFASRHEYDDKKRLMKLENDLVTGAMQNTQYISRGSSKLLEGMKQKRFMNIFACLLESSRRNGSDQQDDKSNILDTSLASAEYLDDFTKEIMEPVLLELRGAQLTFEQFSTMMEDMLGDHSNGPINSILTTRRRKEDVLADEYRRLQKEETFHPKINMVSKELAAGRGKNEPIYETLSKEVKKHHDHVQAERERLRNEEMVECTFKPKLVSKQIDLAGRVYGQSKA